jgi:formylglycine-generating enzyme required for sulfatase activity
MKDKMRFTTFGLLPVLVLILAACQGQVQEAAEQVAPTIEAVVEEVAPTVEAAVEEAVEEAAVDDPDAQPLDAELGDNLVRSADNMTMVYVPEGSFPMGNERGFSSERPVHDVSQGAFWIDGTEVTNEQYALCVKDGSCKQSEYADEADYNGDNYPVVGVSWFDAEAYCVWADARLPTEAEWEYAASGPEGLAHPWGDVFDEEGGANFCDTNCTATSLRDERFDDGYKFTAPVGNYPEGVSWAGALDMSGNVSEWVQDWYDEAYYANSPALNPQGPDSGESKVLRGGSFSDSAADLRAVTRAFANPDEQRDNAGFRCVVTPGK